MACFCSNGSITACETYSSFQSCLLPLLFTIEVGQSILQVHIITQYYATSFNGNLPLTVLHLLFILLSLTFASEASSAARWTFFASDGLAFHVQCKLTAHTHYSCCAIMRAYPGTNIGLEQRYLLSYASEATCSSRQVQGMPNTTSCGNASLLKLYTPSSPH